MSVHAVQAGLGVTSSQAPSQASLQPSADFQQWAAEVYGGLLAGNYGLGPQEGGQRLAPQEALQQMQSGLQAAAQVQAHCVTPEYRQKQAKELKDLQQRLPQEYGVGLRNLTPELLLAYLFGEWSKCHTPRATTAAMMQPGEAEASTSAASMHVAPSTLSKVQATMAAVCSIAAWPSTALEVGWLVVPRAAWAAMPASHPTCAPMGRRGGPF